MRTPTLIFLLSLTACASLRPGPFQSFETSVATAQKGLETEMARDVQWTREADVEALAETKDAPLGDHMLKETKGYAWSTAVTAPHWEARLTLRALEELNAAFLGYANLLTQVAEGQPALSKEHEALSAAINQNLREAAEMLVQTKKTPALFPAGAAALSSESLLHFQWFGRARSLRKALMDNQPWVEEFAAHCLRLIDLIRVDLKTTYGDRMAAIHDRWDDKRTPGRNTLARSIFNLNAEFSDSMVALKALSLFYNGIPAAHQDLADGLGRKAKPQKALVQLATFAERVARLTKDLEKAR